MFFKEERFFQWLIELKVQFGDLFFFKQISIPAYCEPYYFSKKARELSTKPNYPQIIPKSNKALLSDQIQQFGVGHFG